MTLDHYRNRRFFTACARCWELLYHRPNRLLHVTSRDLEKPGSGCDLSIPIECWRVQGLLEEFGHDQHSEQIVDSQLIVSLTI